jgi:hypothetical protein
MSDLPTRFAGLLSRSWRPKKEAAINNPPTVQSAASVPDLPGAKRQGAALRSTSCSAAQR